ncbi:chemotaxis protein CheX [bacterium]|nr:chemotaxis protein CheX [bacterium]
MCIQDLDANFIELFLDSIESTFSKVFNTEVTRGQMSIWRNQLADHDIAVVTGIIGEEHTGMVIYSMKGCTAERMIQFLDPSLAKENDMKMIYDGLSEIICILSGNAMTYFSENEVEIDITTPSIVAGNAFQMHMPNHTMLTADLLSQFGTMDVNIAIKRHGKKHKIKAA